MYLFIHHLFIYLFFYFVSLFAHFFPVPAGCLSSLPLPSHNHPDVLSQTHMHIQTKYTYSFYNALSIVFHDCSVLLNRPYLNTKYNSNFCFSKYVANIHRYVFQSHKRALASGTVVSYTFTLIMWNIFNLSVGGQHCTEVKLLTDIGLRTIIECGCM